VVVLVVMGLFSFFLVTWNYPYTVILGCCACRSFC